MDSNRRMLLKWVGGAGLSVKISAARAQDAWPSRPIRIVVPFGPGGVTDVLARLLSVDMQKNLGQPILVVNTPGAAGMIGGASVARAAPDGYTILFTSNAHTINPALRKELPYDTIKDFTPLVLLAAAPNMLVVRADSSITSVADYIAMGKAKPGEVNFATSGVGTSLHIAGEQFSQITGARFNHVPYSASNQSIQAVLAGDVVSSWSAVNSALPFVKAGRLRALAVAQEKRSRFAPDVPTFAELGVPGMKSETWLGALGPAGLPTSIAERLAAELGGLIRRPDLHERILGLGAEPVGTALQRFDAQIRQEIDMYRGIVKAADIKPT